MATEGAERRLAAILFADAASYSRLVASDDAGTLRHMARNRSLLETKIRERGGRVVDSRGDNLLAEFPTATSAVDAAMRAQEQLEAEECELPKTERLRLRIGIHLGEIVEQDTVAGDAVNIAARLEAIAEPGGVCVSGTVVDQIARRLPYHFERIGARRLKNIPGRVVVYACRRQAPSRRSFFGLGALRASAICVAVLVSAIAILGRPARLEAPPVPENLGAPPVSAVAVLPFTNLSADTTQDYFSDGLAEEVISQLAAAPGLRVAARTSSFSFKERGLDVRHIAAALGVGTVVEGSVRRHGTQLRVTAQLIRASDGFHVWASSYERDARQVFAIQTEIAASITDALEDLIARSSAGTGDAQDATRGPVASRGPRSRPVPTTGEIEAYEEYLRGVRHWLESTERGFREATLAFDRALELDPHFAAAWAGLADGLTGLWDHGYDTRKETIERAEAAARHALRLDARLEEGHVALAYALRAQGRWREARFATEKALEIRPNWARARVELAQTLASEGRLSEATEQTATAVLLDPLSVGVLRQHGRYLMYAGRSEDALTPLWRSLERNPADTLTKLWLWESYHQADRPDDAREMLVLMAPRLVRPLFRTGLRLFGERRVIRTIVLANLLLQPGRCGRDPYAAAYWLAWVGESDRMFECLEERRSRGPISIPNVEPVFDPYRHDPRFRTIVADPQEESG